MHPWGGSGGRHKLFSHQKYTVTFPDLVTYSALQVIVHKSSKLPEHVVAALFIVGNISSVQISSENEIKISNFNEIKIMCRDMN